MTEHRNKGRSCRHAAQQDGVQPPALPCPAGAQSIPLAVLPDQVHKSPRQPYQQLPAITSSRTHVPISCTPISSLVLDLGQISALGYSRARMPHPRSWKLDGTSPGCRPRGLSSPPLPHLSFSSLCFYTGTAAPTSPGACAGWETSARDKNICLVYTGEQQCLFPSYTSCQAAKRPEFLLAEGSTWDLGRTLRF